MTQSFYRNVFAIGFGLAFVLVAGFLRFKIFEVLRWSYVLPVALAALASCLVAFKIDASSYGQHTNALWVVSLALLIFLICALVGCVASFLMNGLILNPSGGAIDFEAWLLNPFLWICSAGIPASIIIALTYRYFAIR